MKSFAPATSLKGVVENIASDKSISHRCAMFSLLAKGACEVQNFLQASDTLDTLKIAQNLGLEVIQKNSNTLSLIPPKNGIKEPNVLLDCGNAGTAMRLYTGLLAGVKGYFVLCGDKYLHARPMQRVIAPLQSIGARIFAREGGYAPLSIIGAKLQGFAYASPIASAQVKSAMLLSGLFASSESRFSEPELSRDHTERMLKKMGAKITKSANTIELEPLQGPLDPFSITIPSDPSSAFFFALAGVIVPGSHLVLKNVLLNPTRIQAYEVLKKMGAKISYENKKEQIETTGDIIIESSDLCAIEVSEHIAWLIDELPALAIAMAVAKGKSVVKNAKELRVKESDRIKAVVSNLQKMGIVATEREDGFEILGGELKPARVDSYGDHRIAMSFAVAMLLCGGEIEDFSCVNISFPNFLEILEQIKKGA
ncbi:3-phosphoshikimate 1-carboxyvinyltransferase [Helicobacter mustelae]|uniref:3-phosphoshikimate 1-carboxyvinyltransferase n=1 Tax=Helicobacter mustelae TaxID=217 RepID=UPI000DFAABA4|nr:3-phosphoshikimate 1-carboxyvinyltransferase [Helicobacter mustelae]STP11958.1 3-phosphoshikimate 1-carboxyvinyltransferase [Helicobacter mustelae]